MQAFHCVRQCKSSRPDAPKDTGGCQVRLHCIQGIWTFVEMRKSVLGLKSKEPGLCHFKRTVLSRKPESWPCRCDFFFSFSFCSPTYFFIFLLSFLPSFISFEKELFSMLSMDPGIWKKVLLLSVKPLTIPLRTNAHNSASSFPLSPPLHVLWLMTWLWDGRKAYLLDSLGRNYLGSIGYSEAGGPRGPVNIVQVSLVQRT